MRVAIISSASAGGAGIAAYRIFEALVESNCFNIDFIDIDTIGETVDINVSPQVSATNNKKSNTHFTIDYTTEPRDWIVSFFLEYDVLNIHWASYLISLSEIKELAKKGKKILFTLHDFYYITGGCHYPAGCIKYQKACLGCPQLNTEVSDYLSIAEAQKNKQEIFSYDNVHLAAPSEYIVHSAFIAGLIPQERGHVLRNIYKPAESFELKEWGSKRSILLIADSFSEHRKGLQLAVDSLVLAFSSDSLRDYELELHLVGGVESAVISQLHGLSVEIYAHGHIKEHDKLVKIFKDCQFILTCSYEDNWPNVMVESGSYGCIPIVGPHHGCEEFAKKFGIPYVSEVYHADSFSYIITKALHETNDNIMSLSNSLSDNVVKLHSDKALEEYITTLSNL